MRNPVLFVLLTAIISGSFCLPSIAQRGDKKGEVQDDPPASLKIPPAPVLTPEQALKSFELVDGFEIEIVASEPLIHDPVAIQIDENGRIWVVEMQSFMPNVAGTGEDEPSSRIVILADTNKDGRMDRSHVFMDGLVLPRALQFVPGGILYADQLKLYFVPVLPGLKPGEPVVIDDKYARGGNVEHKANGLLRGLDNWIYSAKSRSRFRLIDGAWTSDTTEQRGQWGISQDDYGRLYYNGNSSNVYGDWVPAGAMMRNPDIIKKRWSGTNVGIVKDNRVFPIRVTTGVNRGYKNLDSDYKLKGLTAACGPLIYRGTQFPADFYGNAFTPAPCCHLIKRNTLTEKDARVTGEQTYRDHEFLASTDERFRPVALSNAPDGTLYIVDFYRGIIQHKTYVTSYLKRQIESRGLDAPTGLGRIYRIVSTRGHRPMATKSPRFSKLSPKDWVGFLSHENAWWRETAQRLIVDRGQDDLLPFLEKACADTTTPLGQLHALWALEGLNAITHKALNLVSRSSDPKVRAHAIRIAETFVGTEQETAAFSIVKRIASSQGSPDEDLQLALSLGRFHGSEALLLLRSVLQKHSDDDLFIDAAASGLRGREAEMAALLHSADGSPQVDFSKFAKMLNTVDTPSPKSLPPLRLSEKERALYDAGKVVYDNFCMACHQVDGTGIVPLAPPIAESEWVTGSPHRLAAIILNGLQGPITVAGQKYDIPQIQPLMPGLRENPDFTDEKLAGVMTYVRNAFGNRASVVHPENVAHAREALANAGIFTEHSLKQITDPPSPLR